eukprot:CAMPEP_0196587470 /NCGR_PEP_ID=MMETSP1081-20130531/57577_1 /TAXON_ID=36882 /ORGANISM="Pyramimonas amylifera, Strain CCMP720" /LENGTH=195 /DNA_ID=CAMNT_0041909661 /DNA_START=216 /DNA_END=803 /DNA_ORIENTATION=-
MKVANSANQIVSSKLKSSLCGTSLTIKRKPLPSNGSKWTAQWVENKASIEVDVPLPVAWELWDDVSRIPSWMPWVSSVEVVGEKPTRTKWKLSTNQLGRNWEFSWIATNFTPIKYQKIHWSASEGINNRGAVRFFKKPNKQACEVSLTISYEVPQVLESTGRALSPLVEGILQADMERFAKVATKYALEKQGRLN